MLFTIFTNALPECVQICCKVFVDDTKIYDLACNRTKIQEDIYILQEWSDIRNSYFNVRIMHIGRKNEDSDYEG